MLKNQTKINRFKVTINQCELAEDPIVIEEPLQISLLQATTEAVFSLIMRTPGDDAHLIHGLLFCESVIHSAKELLSIQPTIINGQLENNLLTVKIDSSIRLDLKDSVRRYPSYSGCGLCGKTSLQALALKQTRPQQKLTTKINNSLIKKLKGLLAEQPLFSQTGGSHVAGFIYEVDGMLDFTKGCFFEDVGRHNALDKLIGYELVNNDLQQAGILVLSGRLGYELVQKSVMAGFTMIVALGAPSHLAIQAANQFNITLIGFAKDNCFNLYTPHSDLIG